MPYIALWSSEEYSHVAPDKNANNMPSLFRNGSRGEGDPVWGEMHEARQRETVSTCRCQVCNCKLKGDVAYAMDVPHTFQANQLAKPQPLLLEPPVCKRCAAITLKFCPGNKRRQELGQLQCFQVMEWTPVAQVLQHSEGGTEALNRVLAPGETCIGLLRYALRVYRRLDWDELLRDVGVKA